jgi:NAD(P)-dependent dehydrogenase (short-subunit alcohol dehydrogenase family)
MAETALIVGVGSGLSASLARLFAAEGMKVHLAARNATKLAPLAAEVGGVSHTCDASHPDAVEQLFASVGPKLDLVVYNASRRLRGPIEALDPEAVHDAILVSCYGGFLVAQQAAKAMLAQGSGTILLTGASASIKGYAESAPFAMGKFGLRGLAQSLARELGPKNIHVAHFIIDGGIGHAGAPRAAGREADALLDPDAIARSYLAIHRQHRSAWSWELELRPWVEKF